jgi:hypothetical protein
VGLVKIIFLHLVNFKFLNRLTVLFDSRVSDPPHRAVRALDVCYVGASSRLLLLLLLLLLVMAMMMIAIT